MLYLIGHYFEHLVTLVASEFVKRAARRRLGERRSRMRARFSWGVRQYQSLVGLVPAAAFCQTSSLKGLHQTVFGAKRESDS